MDAVCDLYLPLHWLGQCNSSKFFHLWMIADWMSSPTDLLGDFPEWTQHRWYEVSGDQSLDMDNYRLMMHTMIALLCSSIFHSWQECWRWVLMKMSASCQESTHCSLNQGNPDHMMLWEINQFTARISRSQLEIIIMILIYCTVYLLYTHICIYMLCVLIKYKIRSYKFLLHYLHSTLLCDAHENAKCKVHLRNTHFMHFYLQTTCGPLVEGPATVIIINHINGKIFQM